MNDLPEVKDPYDVIPSGRAYKGTRKAFALMKQTLEGQLVKEPTGKLFLVAALGLEVNYASMVTDEQPSLKPKMTLICQTTLRILKSDTFPFWEMKNNGAWTKLESVFDQERGIKVDAWPRSFVLKPMPSKKKDPKKWRLLKHPSANRIGQTHWKT